MKMIIVLDKICLAGAVGLSLYVGYKAGLAHGKVKKILDVKEAEDILR